MLKAKQPVNRTAAVDEYMAQLDHPFKTEVQSAREIIKGVDEGITEEVKWNAPSFSYKGNYLVTFNLRAQQHVHLVFHNPAIVEVKSDLLEGTYEDRRMTYFKSMDHLLSKQAELEQVLRELIRRFDGGSTDA